MYAEIDIPLFTWASKQGLVVATDYRGEEVRSIQISDENGSRFQIWIEPPDDQKHTGFVVKAWDYKNRRLHLPIASPESIVCALDDALFTVREWGGAAHV